MHRSTRKQQQRRGHGGWKWLGALALLWALPALAVAPTAGPPGPRRRRRRTAATTAWRATSWWT